MPILVIPIIISAPIGVCFDLARDAAFHVESARETMERIVTGKTSGLLELGDEVVFEGRHFGVRQKLGARITQMAYPFSFTDEMTRGVFRSLRHVHTFRLVSTGETEMVDRVEWVSPLGILGIVADKIAVEAHLRRFLIQRGQRIKERAESQTSTL